MRLLTLMVLTVVACGEGARDRGASPTKDSTTRGRSAVTPSPSPAPQPAPAARPGKVVASGGRGLRVRAGLPPDSAAAQRMIRKIVQAGVANDVVKAGVSGETSQGALMRMDRDIGGTMNQLALEA